MKVLLLFLCLLIHYVTPFPNYFDVTNPNLDSAWQKYKSTYGKSYSKYLEKIRRLIWEENLEKIQAHNLQFDLGLKSYTLGINKYSDLTFDEFKEAFLASLYSSEADPTGHLSYLPPLNVGKLPDTVDWRKNGYVTPVKDQGKCGSCWSFSATGAMEGQHFRKTKKLESFSEQQLVDCSRSLGNNGCKGGFPSKAFMYAIQNGMESETSYSYKAKDESCKYQSNKVIANFTGFVRLPAGQEDILKEAVASVGPISVCIAVLPSFMHYKSGIYDEPLCSPYRLTHAVLAVGYGQQDGKDYWLVKNSWASSWGMKGYIMMSRNKNNQCGISTMASYPTV